MGSIAVANERPTPLHERLARWFPDLQRISWDLNSLFWMGQRFNEGYASFKEGCRTKNNVKAMLQALGEFLEMVRTLKHNAKIILSGSALDVLRLSVSYEKVPSY